MQQDQYSAVMEKAGKTLSQKNIPDVPEEFQNIKISVLRVKVFRFVTKVKRRIMRRFGR